MKTSALLVPIRPLALFALGIFSFAVRAENVVEIISPDGTTTNAYESFDAGFAAINADGQTIRLLADVTWSVSWQAVDHSLNWNLNGHTLKNWANDFLCLGDNQTHKFYGGGTLHGAGSVFAGSGKGSTVSITNVAITGLCMICDAATIECLADSRIGTDQIASKNSSSTAPCGDVYVRAGTYVTSSRFRDASDPNPSVGVQIHADGGYWNGLVPTDYLEGDRTIYALTMTPSGDSCRHVVRESSLIEGCATDLDGYPFVGSFAEAVSAIQSSGNVRLRRDHVSTETQPTFAKYRDVTVDLDGRTWQIGSANVPVAGTVRLTNGTVCVVVGGTICAFSISGDGAHFFADSTVTLTHTMTGIWDRCIWFMLNHWTNYSSIEFDGTVIKAHHLYSYNDKDEYHAALTVRGYGLIQGVRTVSYRDENGAWPNLANTVVRGGIWNINPSAYVPSGCLVGLGAKSGTWTVFDLSGDIPFDPTVGESYVFSGELPAEGTSVKIVLSEMPKRRTLVGDLTQVTGDLSKLTFSVEGPEDEPKLEATVVDGKLYVRRVFGFMLMFR